MPIAETVVLGADVSIFQPSLVNLYGCSIGARSKIGAFVEIQKNARVGERCKISSHTFICEGVTIEDEVFVGHGVMFTNDLKPRAANPDGSPQTEADWKVVPTLVRRGASIGSNATIVAGITIGQFARGSWCRRHKGCTGPCHRGRGAGANHRRYTQSRVSRTC